MKKYWKYGIGIILIITIIVVLYIFLSKNVFKVKVEIKKVNLELELINTSNNIYSMKIPKGWKMETVGEYENFGFHLYDPDNPARQIFFYGKFSPFLKSKSGKQFWNNYVTTGGYSSSQYLADAYVLNTATVESFFSNFDNFSEYAKQYGINHNFPILGNYEILERLNYVTPMNNVVKDEAILRMLLEQNEVLCEGLVTASVVDAMKYYADGIDTGYYNVYVVSGIIAPVEEYTILEEILSESLSTFAFKQEYIDIGVRQSHWGTQMALDIGKTLSEASDSYNQAWWNRQKSYDALSQKRSDSNLGYDRIYDSVTGDVYRAELGFYDEYKINPEKYGNPNLQLVSDNDYDLYSKEISGYISNSKK